MTSSGGRLAALAARATRRPCLALPVAYDLGDGGDVDDIGRAIDAERGHDREDAEAMMLIAAEHAATTILAE